MPKGNFEFEKALAKKGINFICEVKKASPSKGIIAEDFPYVKIAKEYENKRSKSEFQFQQSLNILKVIKKVFKRNKRKCINTVN